MKYKNTAMALFGALVLGLSTSSYAAGITDTIDASSGQSGTYFVPSLGQETDSPYYRGYNQDWEWQHNAISGSFSTATLNVSAYDVDYPSEQDDIYAFNTNTSTWDFLGSLGGSSNAFSFTEFTLDSSWFDEIATGLQVKMIIDALDDGWLVSLAKSSLSLDGGQIGNPNPSAVPVPAALFMFAPALLGFLGFRRKSKTA